MLDNLRGPGRGKSSGPEVVVSILNYYGTYTWLVHVPLQSASVRILKLVGNIEGSLTETSITYIIRLHS